MRTCERYDISTDKWTQFSEFDEFSVKVSVVTTNNRFIHVFGGHSILRRWPDKEMIRKYDTLRPMTGWRLLTLATARQSCGHSYGLININSDEILIFGGHANYRDMASSDKFKENWAL